MQPRRDDVNSLQSPDLHTAFTYCALMLKPACRPVAFSLPCMMTPWKTNKQNEIHLVSRFPLFHLFMFIPIPPLVCEPFLIRVLSHLSSISKCLPPQGLWATTLTAIWPTTTSDWEGAPEAPAG